jgi:hypothetical protein
MQEQRGALLDHCVHMLHFTSKLQVILRMKKVLNCLACRWLGQLISTWHVELGWPGLHWLARDEGGLVAAISDVSKLGFLANP